MHSGSYTYSQLFEGTCLPKVREASKVDHQFEADQIVVVDRVSSDLDVEFAYVRSKSDSFSRHSMDEPGGISLGRSAVCSIVY